MSETIAAQRERLVEDLKAVIADAEELLAMTADQSGEGVARMRQRVQERLLRARDHLSDIRHSTLERAKEAGEAADRFVHERPWSAIGAAAAVGVVVGLLIGRR